MTSLPVNEARERLSEVVDEAADNGERTLIERSGKPVAAVVSLADYELLRHLEAQEDAADEAAAAAFASEVEAAGGLEHIPSVPLESIFQGLPPKVL